MIYFFYLWVASVLPNAANNEMPYHSLKGMAQGTTYSIRYGSKDKSITKQQVDSIFDKIDSSLSLYKSYSLINRFNHSVEGCEVDQHFVNVVRKALDTYHKTLGKFDMTVQPLVQAWGFGAKAGMDTTAIASLRKCVGSKLVYLENNQLKKRKACVQIDCNGIAQGYSVDVIADFLANNKIENYLVEIGGEIRVMGKNEQAQPWMIGIEKPDDDADYFPMQQTFPLTQGAVTTSGSYRRYFKNGSKTYSHIIDPATGYPSDNGMISVTVVAKDAMTADAYDNAFMVMGAKKSLAFLAGAKGMEAYFVFVRDGRICDTASKGFYNLLNGKNQ